MGSRLNGPGAGFARSAVEQLVPYEPGRPVEDVQRELGLERVVKLASNEGPFGPFPEALEAIQRSLPDLNRYPDGGTYRLRSALAERHGVSLDEVVVTAGADAAVGFLSQAVLETGDEVVTGWPSFISYVLDALKLGAVPKRVPLRDHRFDLDAMLAEVTPKTKLVYVCHPNNPTGTMNTRAELDAYFERVPEHVLTVVDQAYFEYIDRPDYPDAIKEYAKAGRRVLVLRTFSKIYGLAGLRVGYAVGAAPLVEAIGKVRYAFDVNTVAQEAALASLAAPAELERRRRVNADGRAELERILRHEGFDPVPSVGNFLFVQVGDEAAALNDALLREGVIVRPMGAFGDPAALRITVGTPEENAFFAQALGSVLARAR